MTIKHSIILDAEKGEVKTLFGDDYRRMVLIASDAFVKMINVLNTFGSAGSTMFYMMGREKGHYDTFKEIEVMRQRGISITKRLVLENIVYHVNVMGWGATKIQEYDEKRGTVTIHVENNPLVSTLGTKIQSDRPICHYFRGYWVGVISEIMEKIVSCAETKCRSMRDQHCEFKITAT